VIRAWGDEALGTYVGWTAHPGAFDDADVLEDEAGSLALVFSGEDVSGQEALAGLKVRGHRLQAGPSGYLVHLAEEDPAFPAGLNGLFHGVLADHSARTTTLFVDRYGMRRLYAHEAEGSVYFAAEMKAILAVRPDLRRLDPRGLGEHIAFGCVLEDRTLFNGIVALPPGSAWRLQDGRVVRKGRYFEPSEWEAQPRLGGEAFARELCEVFARVLPRYLSGAERVGMSLTGGLDTRAIMAWQPCLPIALPCYTWANARRQTRDVAVARRVAAACAQPHVPIRPPADLLSRFADYAERIVYLGEGGVDVGQAALVWLNQQARAIAPSRLTGLYGGEVLRGVRTFKPRRLLPGLWQSDPGREVERALSTFAEATGTHPVSYAVFRQAPWHQSASLALEATQVTVRTPFLDDDLVQVAYRAPDPAAHGEQACWRLIASGNPALARLPTDRGAVWKPTAPSRVARAFEELLFRAEYAYGTGMPQRLARLDCLARPLRLERLLLGRHRIAHFRLWYRDRLAHYVREMLLDTRSLSRPYLERRAVERVVARHLAGDRDFTAEIHELLTLELLHRRFVDGPLPTGRVDPFVVARA
jgi:asparagine synthase (glutamine-hydrolysing)